MSHDEPLREIELSATSNSSTAVEGATWAWATRQGAAEWASTEQLRLWLQRGDLPPSILVWKPGWGEWLPAQQVAELAAGLPRVQQKASGPLAPPALQSSPTLSPHALDLARPVARSADPTPELPATRRGGWVSLGTLIASAVAVISLGASWAAFSLAMSALQPIEPSSPQSSPSAQPAASDALLRAVAAPAEPALVPTGAHPTADRAPPTSELKPAVLRVGDLPTSRRRARPPAPRAATSRRVSTRH